MHCTLFANGLIEDYSIIHTLLDEESRIVCADGGLIHADQMHLSPDIVIGDFDSLPKAVQQKYSKTLFIHLPDQEKTDLEKAFDYLFLNQAEKITVFGALGKRADHLLANIYLLSLYPETVVFETERETLFALPKKSILYCFKNQIVSLIPLHGPVEEVSTQGLKWELKNATLNQAFISISNVALLEKVSIDYQKGTLLCVLNR